MEDSHIAEMNIPGDIAVFGVFDGHGGKLLTLKLCRARSCILGKRPLHGYPQKSDLFQIQRLPASPP